MSYRPLILMILFTTVDCTVAPTHLLVSRVGPCYDEQSTLISVQELSIMTKTFDSTLSGTFNITEDIPDGWSVKATMQKCLDIRNIDTCDYFKSFFLVRNGCSPNDDEEREIYSLLFHYTIPRVSCPLRYGFHRLINYPVFTEDNYLTVYESKISTSLFGYTFRIEGSTGDGQKMFCVDAHLQLVYLRTHNWIGEKNITSQNKTEGTRKEYYYDD